MSETRVSRPGSTQSGRGSGTDIHVSLKQTEFFKIVDETMMLSRGKGKREEPIRSLEDILFLDVSQQQLIDISQISLCLHLKICIFHSNFVANLEPLSNAPNLKIIDASSNRIKNIPNQQFWTGLPCLEILYLHDNPLAHLECLAMLSGAPKLRIVTLFDTPLSLNNNYRHVAVNSMWQLEGMDFYLISDEEIIQDLDLYDTSYAAMSDPYFLQLYQPLNPNWSYDTANQHILNFLSVVKRKMAKLSPVLILQRYTRGWFARKNLPSDTRNKLNKIKINLYKWFRPLPWQPSNMPNMRDPSYWFMLKALQAPPPTAHATFLPPLLEQTTIDFAKLATSISRKLHNQSIRRFEMRLSQGSHSGKSFSTLNSHSIETDHVARRYSRSYGMFLQLQKLKTNSWRLLNASAPTFGHLYKSSRHKQRKRFRNLSQGSFSASCTSDTTHIFDDVTHVMFRDQYSLVSKQEPIISLDLYREMLFDRRDAGIEIRQAEEDIHDLQRFYSRTNVREIIKDKQQQEEIVADPPMNIRRLESLMKRANGNRNRQKEFREKRDNVEKIREQAVLGKLGADMWREKSRDRLSQLGKRNFEENKEIFEKLKLDDVQSNKLRVREAREKQIQAKDMRESLLKATIQSSNTKEAKLLLSDEVNSKITKDILKKKLKVEKAKDVERQSIQKILQKSIDKTRKIQSIRIAEKEQLIEKIVKADNTRELKNRQRIKSIKTPSDKELFWSQEGITPSYFLPKAGSISPICGRNSVQIKCGARINLAHIN